MFGNISINSQQAMQKPYNNTGFIQSSLFGDADSVYNVGDTSLYPDNAFTMAFWYKAQGDQLTGFYQSGRETTASNRQWLALSNTDNLYYFQTSANGSATENLTASFNLANSLNKWNFIVLTCTRVAGNVRKDIHIYDENNFIVSATTGTYTGMFNVTNLRLNIGATRNAASNSTFRQKMNSFGFWKGYKNPTEVRELWNYGRGLQYSQLTADQRTNLTGWWDLDDWNGTTCAGDIGGENMTRNTNGTTQIFNNGDSDIYMYNNASGTFNFVVPYGYSSLEYLLVGGGGSGGGTIVNNSASGGGGGGEVKTGVINNPTGGTVYSIVIGAGGVARANNVNTAGADGGNSTAFGVTARGGRGGAGGAAVAVNATNGEGAGGGSSVATFTTGGTGTFSGGNGLSTLNGAGGGGALGSGARSVSVSATPDGGGAGFTSTITGVAQIYGAGGGSFAVHATLRNGTTPTAGLGGGSSGRNRVTAAATGAAGAIGACIIKLTKSNLPTPFIATGGTVTVSGGYAIHTFTTTGQTFGVLSGSRNVEYLVVAGGGGSGGLIFSDAGTGSGAGGAGGMLEGTFTNLGTGNYPVVVGSGGIGGTSSVRATAGGDSSINSITATGGGRGAGNDGSSYGAGSGGSGGGGSSFANTAAGLGTSGQGSDGGAGNATGGGGSGGRNGVGSAGGGAGGAGRSSSISGSAVTYAVGAAGRTTNGNGTAGTANRGNGASAAFGASASGAAGGSGIVIVRYLL